MKFKEAHPYAQVLRWIADGEQIQEKRKEWVDCDNRTLLYEIWEDSMDSVENYRLAPRTIFVNGVEVPAPESVSPSGCYYASSPCSKDMFEEHAWTNHGFDKTWLKRGLVYLNKEDAIARAKAMLLTSDK